MSVRSRQDADGYDLDLEVRPRGTLRASIHVFVNGWIHGEWHRGEAPEAQKFWRRQASWVFPKKHRDAAAKAAASRHLPAEVRARERAAVDAQVVMWSPIWSSPKSLVRHLRTTCADVRLLELGHVRPPTQNASGVAS